MNRRALIAVAVGLIAVVAVGFYVWNQRTEDGPSAEEAVNSALASASNFPRPTVNPELADGTESIPTLYLPEGVSESTVARTMCTVAETGLKLKQEKNRQALSGFLTQIAGRYPQPTDAKLKTLQATVKADPKDFQSLADQCRAG